MRITRREAEDALALANVQAMLRVIRQGESSQAEAAYRRRYHPSTITYFDDLSQHPRLFETTPDGRRSSAAGAYQITATTWDDIAPPLGLADFSPRSQDIAAVALIARRGALAPLLAGDFDDAVLRCRLEWTSLPGAAENRAGWTLAAARGFYTSLGGTLAAEAASMAAFNPPAPDPDTQPPAPIEERGVPYQPEEAAMPLPLIAPLLIGLAGELIKAFSPLAQEKIAATLDRHTKDPAVSQAVAKSLVDKAVELTGVADPVEAVVAAKKDPAVVAAAERFTLDELEKLGPIVDRLHAMEKESWTAEEASRAAAADRARDEAHDLAQPLLYAALVAVGAFIVFICAVIGMRVWRGQDPGTELWATLTGLVGWSTAMAQMMYAYRFGTSRQSAGKDVLIGQLSTMKASRPPTA